MKPDSYFNWLMQPVNNTIIFDEYQDNDPQPDVEILPLDKNKETQWPMFTSQLESQA